MLGSRVGSKVESIPEFILSEIGLVVDLHLLVSIDLPFDTSLVVLEGEFCWHTCAAIRRIAHEDRLAQCA